MKRVTARGGQHGPTAFQPRLTLFEHRNAVRQPADFDQFTLDFSQLVTNLAQRPVDLVKHVKQTHTCFAPLIEAARYYLMFRAIALTLRARLRYAVIGAAENSRRLSAV